MKREKALKVAKPILFNTDMVRAIQDSRKTVTRRVVKFKAKYGKSRFEYDAITQSFLEVEEDIEGETHGINSDGSHWHRLLRTRQIAPPYNVGDILYVRETWGRMNANECGDFDCPRYCMSRGFCYRYRAGCDDKSRISDGWFPSIHMPKEAARIFRRVTNVTPQRVKEITEKQAISEGFASISEFIAAFLKMHPNCTENDLVWVIEFEKVEVTE